MAELATQSLESKSPGRRNEPGSAALRGEGGQQGRDAFEKKLQHQTDELNAHDPNGENPDGQGENEIDPDLYDSDGNFDKVSAQAKAMKSFKLKEQSLRCPALDGNPIYQRLKNRLIKFFIEQERYRKYGPSPKQIELKQTLGVDFSYMTKLFGCLKTMLREVINSDDKKNQLHYLKRTYEWFLTQQIAVGLVDRDQQQKEANFLNPNQVEEKRREHEEAEEAERLKLMDDVEHQKYKRKMFEDVERTEHKGILPANQRIKQYKIKTIKRNIPSAASPQQTLQPRLTGAQSTANLQKVSMGGKDDRPTTAALGSTAGVSDLQTQATVAGSLTASNARAISISRFSRFDENEKSVKKYPFEAFFTSNEPTTYQMENRFEGKSNYLAYKPTGEVFEQELEKFWIDCQNKELADKRRDEEEKAMIKEWAHARGRVETDIARKKEHLNVATNFQAARGWVRTNWKTKNYKPGKETREEFLQFSSDEEEGNEQEYDPESPIQSESPSPNKTMDRVRSLDPSKIDRPLNSISALHPGPFGSEFMFCDFTKDPDNYNYRLPTSVQARQLEAIGMHNDKLPPKKKKKEALPELPSVNVYCKTGTQLEKVKKKGQKPKMLVTYSYHNTGMVDEGYKVDPDAPRGAASAFSLENQTRELQRHSSQMRIAKLRQAYGGILQTEQKTTESYDNPFLGLTKDQLVDNKMISLSVYNKPDMLARPRTASINIYQGVKGLEPPKVDDEGNPIIVEEEPVDERLPLDFELPKVSSLEMPENLGYVNVCTQMPRTNTELSRLEQFEECARIKAKLAEKSERYPQHQQIYISMNTLEKAIVLPSEQEWMAKDRQYPSRGDFLMENPFPRAKKKKKGKKGKKK